MPTSTSARKRLQQAISGALPAAVEVTGRYSNRQTAQLATKLLDIALRTKFEGDPKEALE
jgi:hypothetical protein